MVGPEDDAGEAFQDLAQRDIRQLPVVSEGQLVGLVRRRDVVRWLQLQSDLELGLG
ncbi:MAG: CBS domain-containing protein [Anaerolineae bacterium]